MHLLVAGVVEVNGDKGSGKILFTENTLFAFRSPRIPRLALHFGLLGALIYYAICAMRAKKPPPEHLEDPEISALDASTQKKLAAETLLCSFPLRDGFIVTPSKLGFAFTATGRPEVNYKGFMYKKRVIAFLQEQGIPI
ncbi:MAG: hypothetical protein ABSH22_07750 [Tepidisphaeraceae bacterium]